MSSQLSICNSSLNPYGLMNTYFGNGKSTLRKCPKCSFKFGILKKVNILNYCYCMNNYCNYHFGLMYRPEIPINSVPTKDLSVLNIEQVLHHSLK